MVLALWAMSITLSSLGQVINPPAWTTNWVQAVSENTGHNLNAVTWANGLYVAVGARGKILTSADGVQWTTRTSKTIYELFGVTAGKINEKNYFVAVGAQGTILQSTNGVEWLPAKSNTVADLFAVGYGEGTFLAVGVGAFVRTDDQIKWNVSEPPKDNYGGCCFDLEAGTAVAFGDGTFVVSSAFANYQGRGFRKLWTSVDKGKTWLSAIDRAGEWWYRYGAIAYGKGVGFIVIGHHSNPGEGPQNYYGWPHNQIWGVQYSLNQFWYDQNKTGISWNDPNEPQARWAHFSPDGKIWKPIAKPDPINLFAASYGDDTFICVGNNGSVRLTVDGIIWESFSAGTDRRLRGVTYGAGKFVAVGVDGVIVTSPHGNRWTTIIPPVVGGPDRYEVRGVTEGPNATVAVANGGAILKSTDGIRWTNNPTITQADLRNIAYAAGKYVAVGAAGKILTSTDGETWLSSSSGITSTIQSVRYLNGRFTAIGDQGNVINSVDGLQWVKSETGNKSILRDISFGNGTYVIVGDSGTVLISKDDTKTWTLVPQGSTANLTGISFGSENFVLIGENGVVRTSPDGESWRLRANSNASLRAIDFADGLFIAVGDKNSAMTSADGKLWNKLDTMISGEVDFYSARYGSNAVLIVGKYVTILRAGRDGTSGGGSGGGNPGGISLVTQPTTQLVKLGGDAVLFVDASGEGPFTYQWFRNGTAIPGGNQAMLNLTKIDLSQTGKYTVRISNSKTTVESVAATIVTEPELEIGNYAGISIKGIPGQSYFIEYLQDLQNPDSWKPLDQIILVQSVQLWIDVGSLRDGKRFYRVTPVF